MSRASQSQEHPQSSKSSLSQPRVLLRSGFPHKIMHKVLKETGSQLTPKPKRSV